MAPTGLLLTCAHLIEHVPESGDIYVSFPIRPRGRPRQLYLARVVESDETLDLALLALTRDVLVAVEMEGTREVWLVSDARLGPGNSGAGTFDAEGRLVGIHWGAYGETGQTLCYSRPISALPDSWRALIRAQGGEVPGP